MENIFFTSDPHFGHGGKAGNMGVIKFCNRPFRDKWQMDDVLINNWNSVVSPSDRVYCLGDFFFCGKERAIGIVKRLQGQKYWLFGNHDKKSRKWKELTDLFVWTGDYKEIRVSDDGADYRNRPFNKIVMCRYPIASWNGMHHGSWMLHGHSHGSYNIDKNKIVDVGSDVWDYTPVSYQRLKKYMADRPFVPVDGHGLRKKIPTEMD